jgi:pyruvate formate lyase activating enzyme
MKIKGLQRTTLIDYPGKAACTIFLFGCNFRCGFCYNPGLVLKEEHEDFSEEEIFNFLVKRKKYLDAVCITGGEPLMVLEEEFLRKIKNLGYLIKIDTNGSYPEKLKDFISKGLVDFVSMDVKSSKDNYEKVVGVKVDLNKIEESMRIISSLDGYEFRTTIVGRYHNKDELKKIMFWVNHVIGKKPKKFAMQGFKKHHGRFINPDFLNESEVREDFLKELENEVKEYTEMVEVRI